MRRILLGLLVLCLLSGLVAGVHLYLAHRLVWEPELPEPWRSAALAALALLGLLFFLAPIAERTLRPPRLRWVTWPASVWMGFCFLLLLLLGATDLGWWLLGSPATAAEAGNLPDAGPARARAIAVTAVALAAGLAGLRSGLAPPRHRRLEIALARWPAALDGLRVVQISDLHFGPILGRAFAQHLVERVNALEPDLVAVTGDLVDGPVAHLADEVEPLRGLRGRLGVFFVTGNHDHYSGAHAWAAQAAELGMAVLRNQRVEIRDRGAVFDVVGVDDHRGDWLGDDGREDLDAALADRDATRPALLLAHDPSTFKRAWRRGIDLQLSGHTHGGQIWPFRYFVRLAVPYVAGHYRRGDAQLYVSRGTGFWGPPMRLFAPAEITELVLRASDGEGLHSHASRRDLAQPGSPA